MQHILAHAALRVINIWSSNYIYNSTLNNVIQTKILSCHWWSPQKWFPGPTAAIFLAMGGPQTIYRTVSSLPLLQIVPHATAIQAILGERCGGTG